MIWYTIRERSEHKTNHTNTFSIFKISLRILLTLRVLLWRMIMRNPKYFLIDNTNTNERMKWESKQITGNILAISTLSSIRWNGIEWNEMNRKSRNWTIFSYILTLFPIFIRIELDKIILRIGNNKLENIVVNCIKTIWYANQLRSSNVLIQLTHSMLPLSLLNISLTSYSLMSRDNGSILRLICNIECTSTSIIYTNIVNIDKEKEKWIKRTILISMLTRDVDVSATTQISSNTSYIDIRRDNGTNEQSEWSEMRYDVGYSYRGYGWYSSTDNMVAEDLYSLHLYTSKTISNNIIINIDGCVSMYPVMIILCIKDSLREYKSNYVLLSNTILSFYIWIILSEIVIFNLLYWLSFQQQLNTPYIIYNLGNIVIQGYTNMVTIRFTEILTDNGIIVTVMTNENIQIWYTVMIAYTNQFIKGSIMEFTDNNINNNDILLGCILYCISGLHLYHLYIGVIMIVIAVNVSNWTQYHLSLEVYQLRVRLHHMFSNMQLVYWHFVEMLWLIIYYWLYS
jgi:heme/copper-type cytochrome/quinol oxidase subunit 3